MKRQFVCMLGIYLIFGSQLLAFESIARPVWLVPSVENVPHLEQARFSVILSVPSRHLPDQVAFVMVGSGVLASGKVLFASLKYSSRALATSITAVA